LKHIIFLFLLFILVIVIIIKDKQLPQLPKINIIDTTIKTDSLLEKTDALEILVRNNLIKYYKLSTVNAKLYSIIIVKNSLRFNVDWKEIVSKIRIESNFNPFAKSVLTKMTEKESMQRAYGAMQLKPTTAQICAQELNDEWNGLESLANLEKNIQYGTYYYAKMKLILGNKNDAAAAYNVGLYAFYKGMKSERHVKRFICEYKRLSGENVSLLDKEILQLYSVGK
jgi:hypothetical protein